MTTTTREFKPGDGVVADVEGLMWGGYVTGDSDHHFCTSCHCCPVDDDHRADGSICCPGPWYLIQLFNSFGDPLRPMTYAEHELMRSNVGYHKLVEKAAEIRRAAQKATEDGLASGRLIRHYDGNVMVNPQVILAGETPEIRAIAEAETTASLARIEAAWLTGDCPACGKARNACSYSQNPALGRGDCCPGCAHSPAL